LAVTSPGSQTRIRWLGDSQKVIRGFSDEARQNLGNDLQRLDEGEEPLDFAPMARFCRASLSFGMAIPNIGTESSTFRWKA